MMVTVFPAYDLSSHMFSLQLSIPCRSSMSGQMV